MSCPIGGFYEAPTVILLTRLDKSKVLVSLDNIKYIESSPDTLVRFINGDMLIVLESLDEIANLAVAFKMRCQAAAVAVPSDLPVSSGGASLWT
jgi:uncharacterized protein YlzI (FlbEa/FlbD family)